MILIDHLHANEPAVLREKRLPASMRLTCHLVATEGLEEETTFIARLGMQARWRHNDHFDLTPGKAARALAMGAVQGSSLMLVCRNWRRRKRFTARGERPTCICHTCEQETKGGAL